MPKLSLYPKILAVDARLKRLYGEPKMRNRDPASQLVITMLSQATTDVQTDRSFTELRRRFPTWNQVRDARVSDIAKAIRASGLSKQKAPRIKGALKQITRERGRIELGFLEKMPAEEAFRWLTSIKGVGPKTASIVLLFSFHRAFFPVDTHVHRVTKRLGWIPQNATADKAHAILGTAVPARMHYRLHLNLIEHGRAVCKAGKPRCDVCPLRHICDYYRNVDVSRFKPELVDGIMMSIDLSKKNHGLMGNLTNLLVSLFPALEV